MYSQCMSLILNMDLTYWFHFRCVRLDEDLDPVFQTLPLISEAIRMSVDKMCYMSVFGNQSTLEKVPASVRSQYQSFLLTVHKDSESEFVHAWKQWLKDHPGGLDKEENDDIDITADASFFGLADSDESDGEEGGDGEGGGGAAAAPAEAAPAGESEGSTPPAPE